MLRIIAADNHPVALRGLKEIMHEGFPGAIVDETSSGREAIRKIENEAYDLAVIDLSLNDLIGSEVFRQIRRKQPDIPILVWSSHPEDQRAIRVVKAGGNGYLTRQSTSEEIVRAAQSVLSKKTYLDPVFAQKTASRFGSEVAQLPHERLSNRELQIARMIGGGKTIRNINEELGLSINTIRTYKNRILQKIGVKGANELVRYAVKNGLV